MSDRSSSEASSLNPERKRKLVPLRSTSSDETVASLSRNRWEQLRQHVLPVSNRSHTSPTLVLPSGDPQTPLPSFKTSLQKPSRLALLGFRHVVEHVKEADETRKVSQEFEKVCWSIRMADPQKFRTDLNITASSSHRTLPSNTSLASDGTSVVERHSHVQTEHDLRRPQSVQSLKTYRIPLTVKPLYQLLLHHSTPSMERTATSVILPHESLVLSTLMSPFLSTEESQRLDEERWNAIEAFEIIMRSWAPDNEGKGVERFLWCCKAATIPPGAMRTRILSILWGLIIPGDNNYVISTPECFQTLARGLFSLLPQLQPLSSSLIAHEEIPFLMDVISQVRDGCCGELEAHVLQEEYGANFSEKDDKDLIREVILLEALSRCLEDCPNNSRVWLLQYVEHYWIRGPAETKFTPLLLAIYTRTLDTLSRALLDILFVPLDQGASLEGAQHVARLVQSRLIPDIELLGNAVKPEAKMNIVKVVLELSCMDRAIEPVQWGLSLLHTWYRGPSVWRSHLDLTLQEIASTPFSVSHVHVDTLYGLDIQEYLVKCDLQTFNSDQTSS
ncbi:hypothetical protein C0992_004506 [Termitomyces sp. T32_za158]|nr:hypothetical protein C0992_004506 [Termitomyces sp. T32_za158]